MRNGAETDHVWRPVSRVLLWDEAAPARSFAPVITRSMPTTAVEMVTNAEDLLRHCQASPPDLVFVAVRTRSGCGLPIIERLRRDFRTVPVVAVGTRTDGAAMVKAVGAGARGFVVMDGDGATVSETVPSTASFGGSFGSLGSVGSIGASLAGSIGGSVRATPGPVTGRVPVTLAVTERELQILRGMTDGCSNLEIARQLFVSEDTVKTHARRLFRKLGAHDRAHAVALGMRYELVG